MCTLLRKNAAFSLCACVRVCVYLCLSLSLSLSLTHTHTRALKMARYGCDCTTTLAFSICAIKSVYNKKFSKKQLLQVFLSYLLREKESHVFHFRGMVAKYR